jgi:hypothetical protein
MPGRRYHIIAVSLMVAGIVAGAVCWAVDGLAFWLLAGVSAALVIAGLVVAGRAARLDQERDKRTK